MCFSLLKDARSCECAHQCIFSLNWSCPGLFVQGNQRTGHKGLVGCPGRVVLASHSVNLCVCVCPSDPDYPHPHHTNRVMHALPDLHTGKQGSWYIECVPPQCFCLETHHTHTPLHSLTHQEPIYTVKSRIFQILQKMNVFICAYLPCIQGGCGREKQSFRQWAYYAPYINSLGLFCWVNNNKQPQQQLLWLLQKYPTHLFCVISSVYSCYWDGRTYYIRSG